MAAVISPAMFAIEPQDVNTLAESDGFSILREHLAHHYESEYVYLVMMQKQHIS